MAHIVISVIAIIVAMITLILMNNTQAQPNKNEQKIFIPLEQEHDNKSTD